MRCVIVSLPARNTQHATRNKHHHHMGTMAMPMTVTQQQLLEGKTCVAAALCRFEMVCVSLPPSSSSPQCFILLMFELSTLYISHLHPAPPPTPLCLSCTFHTPHYLLSRNRKSKHMQASDVVHQGHLWKVIKQLFPSEGILSPFIFLPLKFLLFFELFFFNISF